jgi:adenosylcobinamide kinase/adenosylcobinamide-phosphate guanylyltransferase
MPKSLVNPHKFNNMHPYGIQMARSEFILGGQKSGKSRHAESQASHWLNARPTNKAVLIATAQPWDEEMRQRIARHQKDRAVRVPSIKTVEEPLALAQAIALHSHPDTLVIVDCLTLWLTNCLMPASEEVLAGNEVGYASLLESIAQTAGPLVLVGNEIGLGVIPMGPQVRKFVDALGRLNQEVASICQSVTLMVAGLPIPLKDLDGIATMQMHV